MQNLKMAPLGFQSIGAGALATAQTLTVPVGAQMAVFSVSGSAASVCWRDDGTAPTASGGINLATGAAPYEYTGNLGAIQFILSAGSPTLNVSFYKIAG